MPRGGKRPGAGRPEGARNKRTVELEQRVAEASAAIEAVMPGAFDGDAHALLMAIYKDPAQPIELRLEAAGKAIRYEKPALASIDVTSTSNVVHVISDEPLSPEDRDREWIEAHGQTLQ